MKIVAIADPLIPASMLEDGTDSLRQAGHDVAIVSWDEVTSVEELQEINLAVEQGGPAAVDLPERLIEKISDADVVITQFAPLSAKTIEQCPALKIIGVQRGGTENVDADAAKELGITVLNTPGRNARAVAEFTVGLILAETRNIARTHSAMMDDVWLKDFPNGDDIRELENLRIGIVGAGSIGQLVLRFLSSFDSDLVYYDPFVFDLEHGTPIDDLDELLSTCDVVSLHTRLSDDTHHLIDDRRLRLMKPTSVLVNTARSGLIDEAALLEALQDRRIMGAAIDTFDSEPLPTGSPWFDLDNVTITSHLAGSTADAFRKTPVLLSERILKAIEEVG